MYIQFSLSLGLGTDRWVSRGEPGYKAVHTRFIHSSPQNDPHGPHSYPPAKWGRTGLSAAFPLVHSASYYDEFFR